MKEFLSTPERRFERIFEIAFLICICVFTALYRWKSVVFPWTLNPDEAQVGANVLRFAKYGLGWDSLDGTTVGPLNTAILAWPYLLGMDVTLSTVRLTALIILCLLLCITYFTMRQFGNKSYAMSLVLFLMAFYALNTNPDYQHFSSELVSNLFISGSIYLCFRCFHNAVAGPATKPVFIGAIGLLLGAVPYAKIQATPIALTIALFALCFVYNEKHGLAKPKRLAFFVFSGLLPTAVILGPLLIKGEFTHFWNSYIVWPTLYVKAPLSFAKFRELLTWEPLLSFIFALPVLVMILLACFNRQEARRSNTVVWGVFLASILVASWFSIIRPGNMFQHYLMFLPAPFLLLAAYALNNITPQKEITGVYYSCYFAGIAFLLYSVTPMLSGVVIATDQKFQARSPRLFDYLDTKETDSVLVWGWMPQWHLISGLAPAARESMNNNQIVGSKLQGYFRERLLSDVQASRPALIIDSVAGKSFGFSDEMNQGIQSFDGLSKLVNSQYQRIQGIHSNPACARTYMRNERIAQFKSSIIGFKSVSAPASWSKEYGPENIDDFSVTEDTCRDFWLPPDNSPGYVDIKFNRPEPVRKVLILNTGNAQFMNHSTSKVEIALLDKDTVVKRMEAVLNPYPQWTAISLDEPVTSDAMRLSVLSWTGVGGGINEIKVLR